jgi:hypothetical protein
MGSIFANRSGLAALAAAGCLAFAASPARATLLWLDQFELGAAPGQYTAGASVAGQAGGTGTFLTGPWEGVNASDLSADNSFILGSSLTRPGQIHPAAGGALGEADVTGCCITQRVGRLFAQPWSGRTPPEGSFYIGFFANFGFGSDGSGAPHHRVLEMWSGAWPGAGGGDDNRNLMFGYSNFAGVSSTAPFPMGMMMKDGSGTTGQSLTKTLAENLAFATDNKTHWVVLRFDLSNTASDTVRAYLDPIGLIEPGTPSVMFAGADYTDGSLDVNLDRIGNIVQFSFTGAEGGARMDDLRIGTTFGDVANLLFIPEPTSLGLFGIACAALGCVRRQRSA